MLYTYWSMSRGIGIEHHRTSNRPILCYSKLLVNLLKADATLAAAKAKCKTSFARKPDVTVRRSPLS